MLVRYFTRVPLPFDPITACASSAIFIGSPSGCWTMSSGASAASGSLGLREDDPSAFRAPHFVLAHGGCRVAARRNLVLPAVGGGRSRGRRRFRGAVGREEIYAPIGAHRHELAGLGPPVGEFHVIEPAAELAELAFFGLAGLLTTCQLVTTASGPTRKPGSYRPVPLARSGRRASRSAIRRSIQMRTSSLLR